MTETRMPAKSHGVRYDATVVKHRIASRAVKDSADEHQFAGYVTMCYSFKAFDDPQRYGPGDAFQRIAALSSRTMRLVTIKSVL